MTKIAKIEKISSYSDRFYENVPASCNMEAKKLLGDWMINCFLMILCLIAPTAWAESETVLWPSVPFFRGQDACQHQYQEAAQDKEESDRIREMTIHLNMLFKEKQASPDEVKLMRKIITLFPRHKGLRGDRESMGQRLETHLKTSLRLTHRKLMSVDPKLRFQSTSALKAILAKLDDTEISSELKAADVGLSGFAWGIYSRMPDCHQEIAVTIYIEVTGAESLRFGWEGPPETVMTTIAEQMTGHFQHTHFPSRVRIGQAYLTILNTPSTPVDGRHADRPEAAQEYCTSMQARLPLQSEYEYLSQLGDWRGGVTLFDGLWALANNEVFDPEGRQSMRQLGSDRGNGHSVFFYCVR